MLAGRGIERRRFIRVDEAAIARIDVDDGDHDDSSVPARTLNFSLGGVLLESSRRLPIGSTVQVQVRLVNEGSVTFRARVLRVRSRSDWSHEVAAEFTGCDVHAHARIHELLVRRIRVDDGSPLSSA